jgi:hypothetical protein
MTKHKTYCKRTVRQKLLNLIEDTQEFDALVKVLSDEPELNDRVKLRLSFTIEPYEEPDEWEYDKALKSFTRCIKTSHPETEEDLELDRIVSKKMQKTCAEYDSKDKAYFRE